MLRLPLRDRFLSWIRPKKLTATQSVYNPILEVVEDSGRLLLNSATANYSYGGLYDAFKQAFDHFGLSRQPFGRVLILGFGAGSIVHLLEPHPQQQVVGVELDPEVIRLYGDFFPQHQGLELVCDDAQSFLEQHALCFDLILVDVFIDRCTPAHLLKKEFLMLLASHLNAEGSCLFNRIEENEPEPAIHAFRAAFAAAFGQMRTFRTGMNTFYFNR